MGILQRMPKPGSFASIACTLSEHLRARPKHLRLPRKEPPAESIARFMARDVRIPTAAKPQKHPSLPSLRGGEPLTVEGRRWKRRRLASLPSS